MWRRLLLVILVIVIAAFHKIPENRNTKYVTDSISIEWNTSLLVVSHIILPLTR
jgi:hypothetical protein